MLRKKAALHHNYYMILVYFLLIVFSVICLVPMLLTVSISLTDSEEILKNGYSLFPRKISFSAYQYIFAEPSGLINGYKISFLLAGVGTVLNVMVTTMVAYPLSRADFRYRRVISLYIFITMIFSGGLVPQYILIVKYLHWKNNLLSLIIPAIAAPFNIFLLRILLQDIPPSLIEAAQIDGSSEANTLFRIVLPLSKPAIATISLMIILAYWNESFNALLYIDNPEKFPIQLVLYNISSFIDQIKSGQINQSGVDVNTASVPSDSIMYALMVLSTAPMLLVFSRLQKYFIKGLSVGSVKG